MATYKGGGISRSLDAGSVDRQLKKLENFDKFYSEIMGRAVENAIGIASARASENAPRLTGELSGSIYKKYLGLNRNNMQIRGAIGAKGQGVKGKVMELGRVPYPGWNRRWRGFFYLYYGVKDKRDEIAGLYEQANEQIVQSLVTK